MPAFTGAGPEALAVSEQRMAMPSPVPAAINAAFPGPGPQSRGEVEELSGGQLGDAPRVGLQIVEHVGVGQAETPASRFASTGQRRLTTWLRPPTTGPATPTAARSTFCRPRERNSAIIAPATEIPGWRSSPRARRRACRQRGETSPRLVLVPPTSPARIIARLYDGDILEMQHSVLQRLKISHPAVIAIPISPI